MNESERRPAPAATAESTAAMMSPMPPAQPPRLGLIFHHRQAARVAEAAASTGENSPSSAEKLVANAESGDPHPNRMRCHRSSQTPLADALMRTLADTDPDIDQDIIRELEKQFLFGKLRYSDGDASRPAHHLRPHSKLEICLQTCKKQRTDHIGRQHKNGTQIEDDAIFDDQDMQLIHQAWMADTDSWMHPDEAKQYHELRQAANAVEKAAEKARIKNKVFTKCGRQHSPHTCSKYWGTNI